MAASCFSPLPRVNLARDPAFTLLGYPATTVWHRPRIRLPSGDCAGGRRVLAALIKAVKIRSLQQIIHALYDAGGSVDGIRKVPSSLHS